MYQKQAHAKTLALVEDQTRRTGRGRAREQAFLGRIAAMAGQRDLESLKERLDGILLSRRFDADVEYAVFDIDGTPDVLCAGAMAPEMDITGAELQDLSELEALMETIGFSLIARDMTGSCGSA
jgi:DNA primase